MSLTPKEAPSGGLVIYPVGIEYSALMSAFSSTGDLGTDATFALGYKPATIDTTKPLCDPTGHYTLLFQKVGSTVECFKDNVSVGTTTIVSTTASDILSEVLTDFVGDTDGYISNLYVVDGTALSFSTFFELSSKVADLWVHKKTVDVTYGTYGGHYEFSNAVDLGVDSSAEDNDWTITGEQSTDTPTNNFATLNGLDPNAGVLSNGNLTLASGTARPTLQPESGTWYYEKNGVGVVYDADVSGKFSPDLTAGTYNFGATAWEDTGPVSGQKALRDASLPEPTILDTSTVSGLVLRTGTGASASVTSLPFAPDFVNIKSRSNQDHWELFDSERGATEALSTNQNIAENTLANGLTSFDSAGYTLGTHTDINRLSATFMDVVLKKDVGAGFDIVAYTGDGTTGKTVAHDLDKVPTFIMVKRLDAAGDWAIYHTALGAAKNMTFSPAAAVMDSTVWNDTEPSSDVITLGGSARVNADGGEYIAYIFTDGDVFRAWSFTGNGSADGPFVDLGGRPLSIMSYKASQVGSSPWYNYDAERSPYNPVDELLYPNTYGVESVNSGYKLSFTSCGFKVLTSNAGYNHSGGLMIGLAVMRQPFKYANAF